MEANPFRTALTCWNNSVKTAVTLSGGGLQLPYDEFNRVPTAGITHVTRLSKMLDEAAVAFLVLTAEDERVDGTMTARLNVIHEVGLFQGRLGFDRAIVMLEEGCERFSNIERLGQIRFPPGTYPPPSKTSAASSSAKDS